MIAPNKSFKPNALRYTNNMADKACHVVGSATHVGLTQALGLIGSSRTSYGKADELLVPCQDIRLGMGLHTSGAGLVGLACVTMRHGHSLILVSERTSGVEGQSV